MARSHSPSTMKKIKNPSIGYEFLRQRITSIGSPIEGIENLRFLIKQNKSLRDLTNDDIDVIIFNQLQKIAENRGWIKSVPTSVFQHK
jgi:hypothetical protein